MHDVTEDKIGDMNFDKSIELGDCGMGMPVIRAWQALKTLPVGGVLHMSSSHL